MSSKLHRVGEVEAEAFRWDGGGSPAGGGSSAIRPPAAVNSANAERERESAYQQGVSAGQAAAEKSVAGRLAPVLENFASIAQELASLKRQVRREAEEPMVRLALAIARRVLHRELATDPEAILGLVRAGLERLNAREEFQLRMAPSDAALVRQHRGQLNLPDAVEIIADATLAGGAAVFETVRGEMDVSAVTQLDEIERGLTDVLRRRA